MVELGNKFELRIENDTAIAALLGVIEKLFDELAFADAGIADREKMFAFIPAAYA